VNALMLAAGIALFGAGGTILAAYLASLALIARSIGLRYTRQQFMAVATPGVSRFRRIAVIHAHNGLNGRSREHSLLIRGKHFCAGCYGLAFGTCVALVLPTAVLMGAVEERTSVILLPAVPFCYLPTILRCVSPLAIDARFRFVSYGLLAIGSWIVIVSVHALWQSPLLNVVILGLVVLGWNCGGLYLQRQRHAT
jgi:hypothetical protein